MAAVLLARRKSRLAGGRHRPFGLERRVALEVDLTPHAARPPRGEADRVALRPERLAHPVDPPEAQRLVARLRPVDRRLAAVLLPEAHEQLVGRRVVLAQPG